MYSNGFSIGVCSQGKFLREKANGEIAIQFGSEYYLRFHNDNSRYAAVRVSIDGEHIGTWEIDPNSFIDIRRPVAVDEAFRFAALDSQAAIQAGKSGPNPNNVKGLIETIFCYEKYQHPPLPLVFSSGIKYGPRAGGQSASLNSASLDWHDSPVSAQSTLGQGSSLLEDGCTIGGNATGQEFPISRRVYESTGTVLKVFLKGYTIGSKELPSAEPASVTKDSSKELRDLQEEAIKLRIQVRLEEERLKKANEKQKLTEEIQKLKQTLQDLEKLR